MAIDRPGDAADPLLSVVIPTLGRPTLSAQLEALSRCTWSHPWEIVVADNAGDGAAAQACAAWADVLPGLRHVDASERRGRSHAINVGARHAAGRWLLFCDDDDLVEPRFVEAVGDAFVAGARVVAFNFAVREINPLHVWRSYAHHELEHGRPMFRSIPAFWGCAAIERDLFGSLGGFDEDRPYAEDLAFSVKLHTETGIEPTWVAEQLLHYRLKSTMRARAAQRVQIVTAVESIAREHPEITPPLQGNRWRRLVKEALASLALAPRAATSEGRLVLADRLGNVWGRFVAAGAPR